MSNQETNAQFLWNHLEERRKGYSYAGVAFDLPEGKLNTAKKIIMWYDSLNNNVKRSIAKRFGLSPEEYKALITKGQELYYDPRYSKVSSGEKIFYITVDILFKDIIKAAAELGLESKYDFVFGLFPIRKLNAEAFKAPDNRGYVIAINTGTFMFLHLLGMIFGSFLTD